MTVDVNGRMSRKGKMRLTKSRTKTKQRKGKGGTRAAGSNFALSMLPEDALDLLESSADGAKGRDYTPSIYPHPRPFDLDFLSGGIGKDIEEEEGDEEMVNPPPPPNILMQPGEERSKTSRGKRTPSGNGFGAAKGASTKRNGNAVGKGKGKVTEVSVPLPVRTNPRSRQYNPSDSFLKHITYHEARKEAEVRRRGCVVVLNAVVMLSSTQCSRAVAGSLPRPPFLNGTTEQLTLANPPLAPTSNDPMLLRLETDERGEAPSEEAEQANR